MNGKPLTGRKVLAIAVSFFGVIIAVNVVMAYSAISTFPGLEVKNGYVSSQVFDSQRQAQDALGWHVQTDLNDGMLTIAFRDADDLPVRVDQISALVARPTHARDDQRPELRYSNGSFQAPLTLAPGQWNLYLEATAYDGTPFRQKIPLYVRG